MLWLARSEHVLLVSETFVVQIECLLIRLPGNLCRRCLVAHALAKGLTEACGV